MEAGERIAGFSGSSCSVMLTPLQPVLESALAPRVSTSAVIEPGSLRSKLSDRAELITFSVGSIRGGGAPDLLSASDPTQRDRAQSVPRSKCRGGRAAPLPVRVRVRSAEEVEQHHYLLGLGLEVPRR